MSLPVLSECPFKRVLSLFSKTSYSYCFISRTRNNVFIIAYDCYTSNRKSMASQLFFFWKISYSYCLIFRTRNNIFVIVCHFYSSERRSMSSKTGSCLFCKRLHTLIVLSVEPEQCTCYRLSLLHCLLHLNVLVKQFLVLFQKDSIFLLFYLKYKE